MLDILFCMSTYTPTRAGSPANSIQVKTERRVGRSFSCHLALVEGGIPSLIRLYRGARQGVLRPRRLRRSVAWVFFASLTQSTVDDWTLR